MSEPMEVKVNVDEWLLCEHMAAAGPDGRIACICRDDEGNVRVEIVCLDLQRTRLRPAPKLEAKVEADGWCVKYYEDGLYSVRRFRNRRCVDALSPHGTIITADEWIKGSNEDTLFRSEAAARSALATWRAKNKPNPSLPRSPRSKRRRCGRL